MLSTIVLPQIQNRISDFNFERLSAYSSVAVLCDSNTSKLCYPLVKAFLPEHTLIEIPAGEEHKTLTTCELVWQAIQILDRKSLLLNVGGGMVSDLGGFCAATYKRGIAFANIPTSLLAMADASIGGKTGIDFQGFKNHIGVFAEPEFIWVCPEFLDTLPLEELRSGFGEVVKHALLVGGELWANVAAIKSIDLVKEADWIGFIELSNALKAQIVAQDPKESGLRKVLNLGHTTAHALETQQLNQQDPILHGQAVAAGLLVEAYISHNICGLPQKELQDISKVITRLFAPVPLGKNLYEIAQNDKKNLAGRVSMSLLQQIGSPVFDVVVERELFEQALNFYLFCYGTGSWPQPPQG